MSEPVSISHVTTTPKPFGVNVEWKWPNGSSWFSKLELQCLREDGRLVKESIYYPDTSHLISGLKSGERVQVRVRIVAVNGSTRDWQVSDWIQGESSVDAGDIVQWLEDEIRNSETFKVLRGECFINDAKIGNCIVSTNYNVKLNMSDTVKRYGCGVGIDVQKGKVEFKADDFKITPGVHPSLGDLFMPTQPEIDAKTSELKKAVDEWIGKMIQLHCKPGGMIWHAIRRN
ncbi:gp24 [Enterobacter hormaechei]|uniref:hypothetical protein n=1 Tax=Enterobacter hormaechei TaxID=158836 RepID=UPI0007952059|nr:hypothetical protein [Enterobacter hormaechei]CZY06708.1 gp24 [Enterobacter hormaechei]